jgi:hypothetical protein
MGGLVYSCVSPVSDYLLIQCIEKLRLMEVVEENEEQFSTRGGWWNVQFFYASGPVCPL